MSAKRSEKTTLSKYVAFFDHYVELSAIRLTSRWQLGGINRLYNQDSQVLVVMIFF